VVEHLAGLPAPIIRRIGLQRMAFRIKGMNESHLLSAA
jgi:hypothetical protein